MPGMLTARRSAPSSCASPSPSGRFTVFSADLHRLRPQSEESPRISAKSPQKGPVGSGNIRESPGPPRARCGLCSREHKYRAIHRVLHGLTLQSEESPKTVRESPGESGVRPGKASHVLVPDFPGLPGLFPDFSRGFSQIYTDLSRKGEKSKNSPEECRKGVSR